MGQRARHLLGRELFVSLFDDGDEVAHEQNKSGRDDHRRFARMEQCSGQCLILLQHIGKQHCGTKYMFSIFVIFIFGVIQLHRAVYISNQLL